ncbi:MAG: DNA polymerase Y family protein, partial [Pacificimonas sp.]
GVDRPPLRVFRRLAEPLGDLDGLTLVLGDLVTDLCVRLGEDEMGVRHLRFTAFRVDGTARAVTARVGRAGRDPTHLMRIWGEELARIDPGFGVESAMLEVLVAAPLAATQDDLAGEARDEAAVAALLDRLAARLGEDAILKPVARGSHMPGRGERHLPIASSREPAPHPVARRQPSPLRLLDRPEQADVIHAVPDGPPARFRWRRRLHQVTKSAGPERFGPEWWRERSTARLRDYYRVEDKAGRRFWLYREGVIGDGHPQTPDWFIHGVDG